MDTSKIDEIAEKVAAQLPPGLRELKDDVDRNLRSALAAVLARMDLVTREEFDVQCRVLARSREKIELLEKQVADLEARILDKSAPD